MITTQSGWTWMVLELIENKVCSSLKVATHVLYLDSR